MLVTSDQVKSQAEELGFSLAGITLPNRSPHFSLYENWLAKGRQAAMTYLETERARRARGDPREILPECRSILVVGMRYPDPRTITEYGDEETHGRVASYAWGDDYHQVFPERLHLLVEWLQEKIPGEVSYRIYTDTGPVLERDLAQQAGLGWIGKNTCLISPRQGSYFLLAEIFLSIPLEPDSPVSHDFCGSCSRCIEACPTNCILPDRTLDAGRCISYLTIENKGEIPEELRPEIGPWVFGCDICQMVCPWNERFSDLQAGQQFNPRRDVPSPVLKKDLHLTSQEFNRKFRNSPVQRAKRRGYLRNIAVALGNMKDKNTVPDLSQALQTEPEPLVRGHVAWALGQINTSEARKVLEDALKIEQDPQVRYEIQQALR